MTTPTTGGPEPSGQLPTDPSLIAAGLPAPASRLASSPAVRRGRAGGNGLILLAALVAVAGIAFALGRTSAPATTSTGFAGTGIQGAPNASFVPGNGQAGPGGPGGSMTISGTVASVDGTTLTIETAAGQTVSVDTSGAAYHAQATATTSDVTTGSTVQVTVSGLGGGFRANASAAPDASGVTAGGGLTASDVTIVAP